MGRAAGLFSGGCVGGLIGKGFGREKEPARAERAAEIPRAAVAMSRIGGEAAARNVELARAVSSLEVPLMECKKVERRGRIQREMPIP